MTDDLPKNRAGNRKGMTPGSRKQRFQPGGKGGNPQNPGGLPKSARKLRKLSRFAAGLAIDEMVRRLENDPDSIDSIALPRYAKTLADYGGYMSDKDQAQLMIQAAAARAHFKKADGSYDEDAFHRFVLVTLGHVPEQQKQLMPPEPAGGIPVGVDMGGSIPAVDTFGSDGPGLALEPDSGAIEAPTAAGVGQFSGEDE